MRSQIIWSEIIPPPDSSELGNTIWSLAFKPDGSEIVMAIGDRIFVYEAQTGNLLHSLRAHDPGKNVYAVAYSKDGKRFASGGADYNVIIWTSKAEGILKYQHQTSIQCLAYNPITHQLASGSCADFGIWGQEQNKVEKFTLPSKTLCMAWSNDGLILAIGMFNGNITLRDKAGVAKENIVRNAPIWCLEWNPSKSKDYSGQLAVGCWDETLSFWDAAGKQIGNDKELGFDPCSISYFSNGEFMVLAGSDKKVTLWTKDGICLGPIGEHKEWIWSAKVRPKNNCVAIGSDKGTICHYQLSFSIVHGLYQERYAYRELMTEVIIQHLVTDQKVSIKCRDLIKKISVYKDRLAVQLPEKVVIYTVQPDDENDMRYKSFKKINKKFECSLMVLTYWNLLFCQDKRLQLFDFSGDLEREWNMEAPVRYIKVIGGPPKKEGVIVGLKSGQVVKIFVDNPFPIPLIKHNSAIRCLDISSYRKKLAIVDENQNLLVYDLKTQEVIFQDSQVSAVAWNSEMEDIIAYSGDGTLSIKTGPFPPTTQKMLGFVVGFKASKIFSLHYITMNTVDVPQSAAMHKYIEQKNLDLAYYVACLGVTEQDWTTLAIEGIQQHKLNLAKKAFLRVKNIRFLELLSRIEIERKDPNYNDYIMMGEVAAYQGKYNEAATLFTKGNDPKRAYNMYNELKQWTKSEAYLKLLDKDEQDPYWKNRAGEEKDWKVAAKMFMNIGDYKKAVILAGDNRDMDFLIEICRQLSKSDNLEALQMCATYFRKNLHHKYAVEAYLKLGDLKALLNLHVELEKWEDAFRVAKQNPELQSLLYLPYANWLISKDKFEEAREAYKKAGKSDVGLRLFEKLIENAYTERRFGDTSRYYWKLALEHLALIKDCMNPTPECVQHFTLYEEFKRFSEVYYAYSFIHRYAESPFLLPTPNYEETIFNACRYLLNSMPNPPPKGINRLYVYFSLGRLASKLGGYKTARVAYEKLQNLKIPSEWQEEVEQAALATKAKPYVDREELFTICYRCMNTNPPLNASGDQCSACKHPVIRSLISFTPLPLVEFEPNNSIEPKRVNMLIHTDSPPKSSKPKKAQAGGWQESLNVEMQDQEDIFVQKIMEWAEVQMTQDEYHPVVVDEYTLASIPAQDIFILDLTKVNPSLPKRYFKLMIPDIEIVLCPNCGHFFLQDEYDLAFLEANACPVCHTQELKEEI